ncbi:hypothetical protein IFO70_39665 [Phormidium tenue FACHB-886]|nr:hypothetical protein [Phormidium tenue FACHB-886]
MARSELCDRLRNARQRHSSFAPAFSTVSTRGEMQGIAEQLAPCFQVVAMDWLGFGQSERPALDYQPVFYCQLLQDHFAFGDSFPPLNPCRGLKKVR